MKITQLRRELHISELSECVERARVSVFIDCENVSAQAFGFVARELGRFGEVVSLQGFCDWSKPSSWGQEICEEYGIEPIQVFRRTRKNSCDLRLARAVFEHIAQIPYSERGREVVALVTSDSDFRDLALSVRARGVRVVGFGYKVSAPCLRRAFTHFIELPQPPKKIPNAIKEPQCYSKAEIRELLEWGMVLTLNDEDGTNKWCSLSELSVTLRELDPRWKPNSFGSSTWKKLFMRFGCFELGRVGMNKHIIAVRKRQD